MGSAPFFGAALGLSRDECEGSPENPFCETHTIAWSITPGRGLFHRWTNALTTVPIQGARFMKSYLWAVAGMLCSAALIGCATTIKPAPQAQKVSGRENAAAATVEGVRMVAQTSEWPGPVPIQQRLTPIRIRIDNNSGQPLLVRYSDFSLVNTRHQLYAALPLYHIKGSVSQFVAPSLVTPGFAYHRFYVAPQLSRTYPSIPPYNGNFYYDPLYESRYNDYWHDAPLPTATMWQKALPEGVIDSGGSVQGWLYFEKIGKEMHHLIFRADLVNAASGRKFAEIRIPFVVK